MREKSTTGQVQYDASYTPLSLNPPPYPGDADAVLTCEDCGAQYTMREYRVFQWVESSPWCVTCASKRISRKIGEMLDAQHSRSKRLSR